jgi:hypothetical protein
LPATDSDWSQQFTVNLLSADEKALPIAHTCFFSIDLPPYKTAETLRAKLLYAIYNCTAIDGMIVASCTSSFVSGGR